MNRSIVCFVACLLGVVGCNVEHYEDCNGIDKFDPEGDFGGSHSRAGSPSKGGSTTAIGGTSSTNAGSNYGAAAGSGASDSGGTLSDAGADGSGEAGTPTVPATPCEKEHDCAPGYNCDLMLHECLPAAEETCAELDTEVACTHRSDCTPIYGGTNCSCGQDCECHGGEPGCVCEMFGFVVCK
jgi:hypothetical protein